MGLIEELKLEKNVPVVIANHDGIIIYVNSVFEKIFEWSSDEIVGKALTTIIPSYLHDAHNLGFSRFLSTEKTTILNHALYLKAVKKNGELFLAEHLIRAEQNNGQWVFGATIRPLEEPAHDR